MGVLLAHTIHFLRDTNPYLTALYDNIGFLNHIKSISQERLPASAYPMLKLFVERVDIVDRPVVAHTQRCAYNILSTLTSQYEAGNQQLQFKQVLLEGVVKQYDPLGLIANR